MLTYDVSSLGSTEFDRTVEKSASFSEVIAKLTAFQFPMHEGVRLIPVQLIPEVSENQDYSPLSIRWNGELLGHLPEDLAQDYQQILRLSASRCVATSFAKISEDGEELTVSLRSPGLLLPLNNPPRDPYALLPATTSLTLTHNEGLEHILADYLPPEGTGLLLVTLHNVEVLNERNRQAVEVRLDGQRIGELPASENKNFKGTISYFAGLGMLTTATAQISGSETSPLLRVTTTPAKRLTTSLLRPPSDHPLPTLVPFAENPQDYILPEDFDALQLLSDAVVRIPINQGQERDQAAHTEPDQTVNSETNQAVNSETNQARNQEAVDDTSVEDDENLVPHIAAWPETETKEPTEYQAPEQDNQAQDIGEVGAQWQDDGEVNTRAQAPAEQDDQSQVQSQQSTTQPPEFFEVSSVADNHVVLMEPAPSTDLSEPDNGRSSDTQEIFGAHYEPPLYGAGPSFGVVSSSPATITFGDRIGVDKGIPDGEEPEEEITFEEFTPEESDTHTVAIIGLIVGSLILLFGALHAITSSSMLFFLGMAFLGLSAFAPALWWFYCEYAEHGSSGSSRQRYWPLVILGAVASACAGIFITWEAVSGVKDIEPSGEKPEPTILPELTSQAPSSETPTTSTEAPIAATEISLEPPVEEFSSPHNIEDSPSRNGNDTQGTQPRSEQPRGEQTPRTVVNPPDTPRDAQPQYTYITVYPEDDGADAESSDDGNEVYTQYEVVEEEVVSEVPATTPAQVTVSATASASQPAPATSRSAG